jgi:hypothetical protein
LPGKTQMTLDYLLPRLNTIIVSVTLGSLLAAQIV